MSAQPGWVYLVGAGPGDPGLITRRGLELLRTADVVLADRLVAPELAQEVRAGAEVIDVGKSSEGVSPSQAEIDARLVDAARRGLAVVRLKGGDPYVLGRGADEAQALAAAGIPFEVVPGVSASVAVPAYAGIPVTHGGVASSFAVATVHEGGSERLAHLARGADTLVLLMGVRHLESTLQVLMDAGRSSDEPAALIEWGTTPRQRSITATLATLAAEARREGFAPPSTLIVGDVVKLRSALSWFEDRPLFGKRVVVTRAEEQAGELIGELRNLGADVIGLPLIAIGDPSSWEGADAAAIRLPDHLYSWVIFSSVNCVERFMQRLDRLGLDARSLHRTHLAAVGPKTAEALKGWGLRADLVPDTFTGTAMVDGIGHGGGVVLVPRGEGAPVELTERLQRHGWRVQAIDVYRNVPGSPSEHALAEVRTQSYDAVVFMSASAVRNFEPVTGVRPRGSIVCIGPKTQAAADELGIEVEAVAEEHSTQGVVEALLQTLKAGSH